MLKALIYFLFTAVWTAILLPLALLSMLLRWDGGASIWWARHAWSPALLAFGGVKLEVIGQENVDPHRATIYAANHQSAVDIPALFMAIPSNVRYVAKRQLGLVPFFGWYLHLARYPLIDRSNRARAIASLEKAGQQIRDGISIIVYPEGTRSADGTVLPFKKGPFALALKARVPICPVTIIGSDYVMPKNSWNARSGTVKVVIGKPIDISSYADSERERLAHDVRQIIIEQSLAHGGKGGDVEDAVADPGVEGLGKRHDHRSMQRRAS